MRAARKAAPESERGNDNPAGPPVPLTTTRAALLVDGSDRVFREMLRDLMTMASQLQELRAGLARQLGVSEPEYRVFLAVAQLQEAKGVSISAVARHLGVSGAFVTMIVQRLVRAGKVQKTPSRTDRRGVLLTLTARGRAAITGFARYPQMVNDELFRDIDEKEFRLLADIVRRIVAGGERAILLRQVDQLGRRDGRTRESMT
jgi:MarR family transcriptional regulator, organic hydroperoxide resistance regulator